MTLPPRAAMTCSHRIPIGGVDHVVQSEFVAGKPARVDSRVRVEGRIVVKRSAALESIEPPTDAASMTRLLENRQKSTIRRLVEARRAEVAADADTSGVRAEGLRGHGNRNRGAAEARLRRHMVRFARGVERLVQADSSHAEKLRRLVHESEILLSGEDERSRSREVAELHLLRAEAERCLDGARSEGWEQLLVVEFVRMARALKKINDRASLRSFDLDALERIDHKLRRISDNASLGDEMEQELWLIWGRDRQLDEQMAMHSDLCAGDIRLPLRRTLERLRREVAADLR